MNSVFFNTMDSFSDTKSPSSSIIGSEAVPDDAVQSNEVANNSVETKAKESQPSYKLTWKVENGQLVRHWVEA